MRRRATASAVAVRALLSRGGGTHRRVAAAAAAGALAVLSGGCGNDDAITRGGAVVGTTLTVYSLLPAPAGGAARDVVDGQRLALREAGAKAGEYKVSFTSLDATADPEDEGLPSAVAAAARKAITDPQIVAVIGDLDARTARVTVPLFNSAGVLHVSPGVTYPGFTRRVEPGEPERFYPAGPRTFFPLAPDDAEQGRALAGAVRGRVLVEQEESASGRAFGAALRAALGAGRLARSARDADAAVYAGTDPESARGVVGGLLRESRRLPVYLHSALDGTPLAARPRVRALRVGEAPSGEFERSFRIAFGRAPSARAVAGHAAMRAVLAAIARGGERARRRQTVIDGFAADELGLFLGDQRLR